MVIASGYGMGYQGFVVSAANVLHMVYSVRLAPVTRFGLQIPGLDCKVWVLGMSISREVSTVQSLGICIGFGHDSF